MWSLGPGPACPGYPEVSRPGQMWVWWEVRMSQPLSLVSLCLSADWDVGRS